MGIDASFWEGRRVLLTGHTGLKGSWLALWLADLGADVTGFSSAPPTEPSLFALAGAGQRIRTIEGDASVWEQEPVEGLARDGQLRAFRHAGFWRAMDNVRDRNALEELWRSREAPWKVWD